MPQMVGRRVWYGTYHGSVAGSLRSTFIFSHSFCAIDKIKADSCDSDTDEEEEGDDMGKLQKSVVESSTTRSINKKSGKPSRATCLSRRLRSSPGHTVLYLGHLPREFGEKELAHFLKQFGRVVNIRVVRSKRTGNSRGFSFFQMADEHTASIVADTLSGYILMGKRRLVCHVVPPEKVTGNLFFKPVPPKASKGAAAPQRSLEKIKTVTARLVARERKKKAMLQSAGIDYDYPGFEAANDERTDSEKIEKKRKDSIDSSSNKKKRQDSVDQSESSSRARSESVDSATRKKKRSNSFDNTTKEKKRRESMESVDSTGSKKKRKRKGSTGSYSNEGDVNPQSSGKVRSNSIDSSSKKEKKKDSAKKKRQNMT